MMIALLASGNLDAQSDWKTVEQLPAGSKLRIALDDGARINGLVAAATDQALRLQAGREIPRASVRQIWDRAKSHRRRNALIGAAIGVGAGAILDATVGTYARNESRPEVRTGLYVYSIGISAGIGALFPSHPRIYKRP